MIIENNRASIETDGIMTESFFNVKQENLAHIFSILRNQLYSNKSLAIVREYCTNAFDAHIEANISDTPIEITFPTQFEKNLIIRDFGFGLSEDDVFNIFASYGESTKRNTNSQVGMMGLGSKSAFCYTDTFNIISYNSGKKTIYSAYIDDTGIGKISKISSEESDETGIAIQIPIRREDLWTFENTLFNFLKEFNPKPIIKNNTLIDEKIKSYSPQIVLSGKDWQLRSRISSHNNAHIVKMGNVEYTFTRNDLELDDDTNTFLHNMKNCIYINANIGDVKPSASRELLDFIPKTKQYLCNKITEIRNEILQISIDKVINSPSYWEALINYSLIKNYLTKGNKEFEVFGKTIDSDVLRISNFAIHRHYKEGKWEVYSSIQAKKNQVFFIYKGNVPRKTIFVRANSYIHQNKLDSEEIYFIGFHNQDEADEWISQGFFDGVNTIDVADIPYIHSKKARVKTGYEKAEVYKFKNDGLYSKCRDFWQAQDSQVLEQEEGVYIPIKYFSPTNSKSHSNENINLLVNNLKNLGIEKPTIYGISPKDISNLGEGWISLDQYIQQSFDELDDDHVKNLIYTTFNSHFKQNIFKIAKELGNDDTTGFKDLVEPWLYCTTVWKADLTLFIRLGYKIDTSEFNQFKTDQDTLLEKFPLLKLLKDWSLDEQNIVEICKYIKSIS